MPRPAVPTALAAVAASLVLPAAVAAAPGDFDPAFNGASPRVFQLSADPSPSTTIWSVVPLPSGGVVGVGSTTAGGDARLAVVRYGPDGEPDTSLAGDGSLVLHPGIGPSPEGDALLSDVIVGADGRMTISAVGTDESDVRSQVVLRLLPDGTPDPTFSGDGRSYLRPAGGTQPQAFGLVALPDGKLLVSGSINVGTERRGTVTRLTSEGVVDTDYGTGGSFVRELSEPGATSPGTQIVRGALAPDGGYYVPYTLRNAADELVTGILRLTPSGTLDTAFGQSGLARLDEPGSVLVEAVVRPDGRVVAGGIIGTQGAVMQVEADGRRSTGFGSEGVARFTLNGGGAQTTQTVFYGTAVQPNNRIVLASAVLDGPAPRPGGVVRLMPGGSLDASFGGGDGYANPPADGDPAAIVTVAYGAGRIFAGGYAGSAGTLRGVVSRLLADSAPVASLTGPANAVAGTAATFDASGSTDDAGIAGYAWDLDGDGAFTDATGPTASSTFPAAGTRVVRVRVTDDVGQTAVAERAVAVTAAPVPPEVVPPAATSKATLVSKTLSVDSKGRALVRLRCSAGAGCTGTLSLRGRLAKRGKVLTLGKRSYKLAGGRPATVLLTLTKATRRAVRVRSVKGLKLAITPTGGKAATSTVTLRKNRKVKR